MIKRLVDYCYLMRAIKKVFLPCEVEYFKSYERKLGKIVTFAIDDNWKCCEYENGERVFL